MINARTTNWTRRAVGRAPSGRAPSSRRSTATRRSTRLWEQLVYVLRLDEPDPAAAWRARLQELHDAGARIDAHRFDALRFEGPGTDLTVGLLPTSRFSSETPGHADGRRRRPCAEHPDGGDRDRARSARASTASSPRRSRSTSRARVVDGSRDPVRGRPRRRDRRRRTPTRSAHATRRRRRRVAARRGRARRPRRAASAKTGTVFFNTLLDENAASHLAFGNAYAISVGEEDRDRINESAIHIDFMIGSDDVTVTGLARRRARLPVLRGGVWQV